MNENLRGGTHESSRYDQPARLANSGTALPRAVGRTAHCGTGARFEGTELKVKDSVLGEKTSMADLSVQIRSLNVRTASEADYHLLNTSDNRLQSVTHVTHKQWMIEPCHKSLTQNATLERSPAHTVTTQTNHISASLCAFIKLEMLKGKTKLNHFALKSHLYLQAVQAAFDSLRLLQPIKLAV